MYYQLLQNEDHSYAITVPVGNTQELRKILMPNVGKNFKEIHKMLLSLNNLKEEEVRQASESEKVLEKQKTPHLYIRAFDDSDACICGLKPFNNIHFEQTNS